MIKTFISRILNKRAAAADTTVANRIPVSKHGIHVDWVDRRALDVVKTLQERGFEAFIVGGAVRDLLLGLKPKDFDVATNATPEQVKSAFRRAFIIGKRFRIVHVVFGRGREHEVIEVTTFRANLSSDQAHQVAGNERTSKKDLMNLSHAVDASGRLLRDNVWGSQHEDAARRDFTVNAMYYDPVSEVLIDYHGGYNDAKKRVLRMIGDPAHRYREDPVRIVRAVRFCAKLKGLKFKLDPATAKPMLKLLPLLEQVPQSRMFDEMLKLLQTGHAIDSVATLQQLGLSKGIYPLLDVVVDRAQLPLVAAALADTDRRVGEGKPVAPSFLLACVLWSDVDNRWQAHRAKLAPQPALMSAMDEVFEWRVGDVSGRGKLAADMRDIWSMQPRFEKRTAATCMSLVAQPRFRAGFDFMRLRAQAGELPMELADWWERFSLATPEDQQDMIQEMRRASAQRVRHDAPKSEAGEAASTQGASPSARRRRRRKSTRPHPEGGSPGGDDSHA
ncbi:MAG: hypothetical protein RL111_703 [Pseudomonadota bacterium]